MRVLLSALLLACLAASTASAAAGDLDRRFGKTGVALISLTEASTQARATTVQPDGKVLVTGTGPRGWIVTRLLRSGRPDPRFGTRGRVTVPVDGEPIALELTADGRILVAGTADTNGSSDEMLVARLLPEGRADVTWGAGGLGTLKAPHRVFIGGLAVQPDGGVALSAAMHGPSDQHLIVMRLGPGGRPDTAFGEGGAYVEPGRGAGYALVGRPDGGLIVGGESGSYYSDDNRELLVALTPAGRLDRGWGQDGRVTGPAGSHVQWLEAAPGGGVVVLDRLRSQYGLLALRADGSRREEWGLEGRASVDAVGYHASRHAVDRMGQVHVAGTMDGPSYNSLRTTPTLVRVDANGVTDLDFGRGVRALVPLRKPLARALGEDVAVAPSQRVYVAASGSDGFAGDREDYGFTHAAVAAFKGWDQLVTLHFPAVTPTRRRLAVTVRCRGTGPCRIRLEVRDRRGRRIARRTATRDAWFESRFALTPSRRLRAGERLTIRVTAANAAGQSDAARRRFTVPKRRR